jgi:hypothetical protein
LATRPEIASTGEPWFCLPLAFLDRDYGMEAIYDQGNAAKGIREMIDNLPGGRPTYVAHLRQLCVALFRELAHDKSIFIDKDPRYYLILDFLVELFPDAKFIFLFRNPLDVMCSMMSTWLENLLLLHAYHIDLYEGVRSMSRGSLVYAKRSINVHYEDLVRGPQQEVRRVCDFLGVGYDAEMLVKFQTVDFGGSMGDPTGIHQYDCISADSANVWPQRLNNCYRVRFAREYLATLGDDILTPWRFSRKEFEQTVSQMRIHFRGSIKDMAYRHASDLWRMISGTRIRHMLRERRDREIFLFR